MVSLLTRSSFVLSKFICGWEQQQGLFTCRILYGQCIQFKLSDIGEGIAEVQIKKWHVKPGDSIKEFENLCEVESDKATVTITSRYTGVIKKLFHDVDEIARVGNPLLEIELESDAETSTPSEKVSSSSASSSDSASVEQPSIEKDFFGNKALATPAVRRIARENKINLISVTATGKDGRVLKEDILRYMDDNIMATDRTEKEEPIRPPTSKPQITPSVVPMEADRTIPLRGYTRAMFKAMSVTTEIPHFGYCDELCVDRLMDLRLQLKAIASDLGIKMSYMPLFIKAASLALKQFPILNASLDAKAETVTLKGAHNICIAMDTPGGLAVPNIKNCESRNLWDIAKELNRLHEAGKKKQFVKEDLANGTFTLSNIGTIGGTYLHPVITPPQVAIGALGRIQVLPRFNSKKEVYGANMVRVSWSADHRVIDGATVARFSNLWKQYLENPALMIAEMK